MGRNKWGMIPVAVVFSSWMSLLNPDVQGLHAQGFADAQVRMMSNDLRSPQRLFSRAPFDHDRHLYVDLYWGLLNQARLRTISGRDVEQGAFAGGGFGLEYYYRNDRAFSLSAAGAIMKNFSRPGERDAQQSGVEERGLAWAICARHQQVISEHLELGYGLQFLHEEWKMEDYYGSDDIFVYSSTQNGFGPDLFLAYRLNSMLRFSAEYLPAVVEKKDNRWQPGYFHFLTIGVHVNFTAWHSKEK